MNAAQTKAKSSSFPFPVKVISFILIFFVLLFLTSRILIPKSNKDLLFFNAGGIFSLPKNSIDYVVIGNSNAVEGFSPLDIWNNFGYAGYTCGEPWQNTCGSYFMIKQILKKQSPKVIVLDTDTLYERKNTITSLENDLGISLQYYFPVLRYHNYWKRLNLSDFKAEISNNWHHDNYGHLVSTKINAYSGTKYMSPTDKVQEMTPQMKYYLDLIVSLCRENGIALVLVSIPSPTYWNMAQHNAVAEYSRDREINYVDLNLNYQDCGIDWSTDTRDKGEHLNCYGAQKVSNYIGRYILENYSLPDHKGDPKYEQMNKDYQTYLKIITQTPAS